MVNRCSIKIIIIRKWIKQSKFLIRNLALKNLEQMQHLDLVKVDVYGQMPINQILQLLPLKQEWLTSVWDLTMLIW